MAIPWEDEFLVDRLCELLAICVHLVNALPNKVKLFLKVVVAAAVIGLGD